MKVLSIVLVLSLALFGAPLLASSDGPQVLDQATAATIQAGAQDGDIDVDIKPLLLRWKCMDVGANCQDCIGNTRCTKNVTFKVCVFTGKFTDSCDPNKSTIDCGKVAIYPQVGCVGLAAIGGACKEKSCA